MDGKFAKYSEMLTKAQETRTQCSPITESDKAFTVNEAYTFSKLRVAERVKAHRTAVVGRKIGITSPDLQKMLNVSEPIFGYLTADRKIEDGGSIPAGTLIGPRAEGEVVFILMRDLPHLRPAREDVLAACEVALGIEIVDSRFKIPCRIQDIIADNSAAAHFVVSGKRHRSDIVDFAKAKMIAKKNGTLAAEGSGREVMGDPVHTLMWLATAAAAAGEPLKKGDIVFSGSFTAMGIPFSQGDVIEIEIEGLGSAAVRYG